jgi:radical SAM protein (TIGR01212 family)
MQAPPLYRTFTSFLAEHLEVKVQKIALNAGFTCPNRDGSKGKGGCTYCNNQTFNPSYGLTHQSVTEQMKDGIRFFARKYPTMKYLAYFQAYTNTYASVDQCIALYEEALAVPDVVGLVIGTRPDCLPEPLLDYLEALATRVFVLVELGLESTLDRTLTLINRQHDQACSAEALHRLAERGLLSGAHLILGLPGETPDDMLHHADVLSGLPLDTLKLHQLQVIKGTTLAEQVAKDPTLIHRFTPETYVDVLVRFLERLRPDIAVERFVSQSPPDLLVSPDWGLKNYAFTHQVEQRLLAAGSHQGRHWAARLNA